MEIKDIENLAELSKIDLNEEEKAKLLSDVKEILDYVKVIEKVEVKDIEPNYITHNIWREDLPASGAVNTSRVFSRDLIIKQFPDSQDGFLKVKKIL